MQMQVCKHARRFPFALVFVNYTILPAPMSSAARKRVKTIPAAHQAVGTYLYTEENFSLPVDSGFLR
ncbi:MAG: hypothetical protein SOT76_07575, partial [Eubacteriales bacterium]|nr:hypothetical protein [Eubacteriales bacterium]